MGSGHKPMQKLGDNLRNEQQKAMLLAEAARLDWELNSTYLCAQSRELRLENRKLRQRAHKPYHAGNAYPTAIEPTVTFRLPPLPARGCTIFPLGTPGELDHKHQFRSRTVQTQAL
jgi:hypothetical protein